MKLHFKTLLIVGTTLLFLLVILNAVSRQVLLSGFARVEREDTDRNVKRVLDAFTESVNNLSVKAADWAKWDDTYQFVKDRNREYIESNLTDESLAELKLNLMLFFDSTGQMVHGRSYNLEKEAGEPVTAEDLAVVAADSLLMRHTSLENVVAGVKVFPGGPMNVVSRPVLTSSGEGPIAGTIVFGRYIDANEVERIGHITHLALVVHPCSSSSLPRDIAEANKIISKETPRYINPLNDSRIAGYSRIPDIHGRPVLLVRIDMPRDIHQQGKRTMSYLMVAILTAGIIFGLVIVILLQKAVLARIAKLSFDVNSIAEKGDHTARVRTAGKDELTALGNSVNGMLSALERVEEQVRSRNREMRMIMNTVPSGLLSIDENFRINPEYSQSVESILMKVDLAGKDFFATIGLGAERGADRTLLFDFLDLVMREVLSDRELAALNPFEELGIGKKDDRAVWIRLTYFVIHREEGRKNHLLVVIEDITEAKLLSERVRTSERENMQLKAIVEDPDLFKDFLVEMKKILSFVQERVDLMASPGEGRSVVNEVFRGVHTIKGTAGAFGLSAVVEIAGQLEESLSACRDAQTVSPGIVEATRQSLGHLSKAVMDVVENAKKILGEDFSDSADINLRISLEKLKRESAAIRDLVGMELLDKDAAGKLQTKIHDQLRSLREVPARRGLAKAFRIIPGLLKKIDKNVAIELDGAEVPVDCEIARELTTPLVHMFRNAVDHGIESPEERIAGGKEDGGKVKVTVRKDAEGLKLQIADDGRGLDPQRLKRHAVTKGVLSDAEALLMSDEDARRLIFKPGFSTAEAVTEVSGRGVGMDVVLDTICNRLKGQILIDSEIGRGTTFTMVIPGGGS